MDLRREMLEGEVVDYAMSSEENLRIAVEVYNAFPSMQSKVVRALLRSFEARLTKDFYFEWFNDWLSEPLGHQKAFGCRQPYWPRGVYIGFGGEEKSNNISYGVIVMDGASADILALLKARLPETSLGHGKSDGMWPWFQYVDQKYRHWSNPNTLPNLLCPADGGHPLIVRFEQEALRIADAINQVLKHHSP